MMSKIEVRVAKKNDLSAMAQIYLEDRQRYFNWVLNPQLADLVAETKRERLIVALIDDQVVGFAALYELISFVHLLFVAPQHQRQGVGLALIKTLSQMAREPLTLKCVQRNDSALAFYQQIGFVITKDNQYATPANFTLKLVHPDWN
ncbi:GNAT family N-acetyltransferase [Loigolactobacillus iwatensis]|uniref:GNAT family N-acetyltransferase n=1 Tax=Loigolactobacillus iwatensis TaxID=1267156 RepID=UPI001CDCEC05|nr:GNAT family N-acetyltransferase [Loigolactobacillus iwatensis]